MSCACLSNYAQVCIHHHFSAKKRLILAVSNKYATKFMAVNLNNSSDGPIYLKTFIFKMGQNSGFI